MVTMKVARRALVRPLAVEFPENRERPESLAVKVPHATAETRSAGSAVFFDALAAALFVCLIVALIVVVCGGLMIAAPRP